MNEPAITALETMIINHVLARLYLDSPALSHPTRLEEMKSVDQVYGIQRLPTAEMQQTIQELIDSEQDLGGELRTRMIEELVVLAPHWGAPETQCQIEELMHSFLGQAGIELAEKERQTLFNAVLADIMGLGPLEPLLADASVAAIMVDGPNRVYVERQGRLEDAPRSFRDDEHLLRNIRRILTPIGIKADASNPIVDVRLPDGSRLNVVVPPVSLNGPVLTIRKQFAHQSLSMDDLVSLGSVSQEIVDFLHACVRARLNIIVAGGTNSGKTTVLNLVANMIPKGERIIVVQNAEELKLGHRRVVTLETRPPNLEGQGQVTAEDLVRNALRMRPDRIVLAEIRGGEIRTLLEGMNTGHDGTLANIHANSPRDVLTRIERMATSADPSIPLLNHRQQMSTAIDLITYQEQLQDGTRKLLQVTEVLGMQGDVIELRDIFEYQQTGVRDGKITGSFTATGYIPSFADRLREAVPDLNLDILSPR